MQKLACIDSLRCRLLKIRYVPQAIELAWHSISDTSSVAMQIHVLLKSTEKQLRQELARYHSGKTSL